MPWFLVWYIHVHWIVNSPAYSQSTTTFHFFACVQVSGAWGCRFCVSRLAMVVQHSFTKKKTLVFTSQYTCIYPRLSCFERLFPSISISDLENAFTIVRIWWKTERKLCPTILSYSRCKYFFVPDSLLISIHFIIHVYIYVDYGFNKHRIPLLLDQIVLIKKPMDLTKLQIGIRVQSFSAILLLT